MKFFLHNVLTLAIGLALLNVTLEDNSNRPMLNEYK